MERKVNRMNVCLPSLLLLMGSEDLTAYQSQPEFLMKPTEKGQLSQTVWLFLQKALDKVQALEQINMCGLNPLCSGFSHP